MSTQKVYVIDSPKHNATRRPKVARGSKQAPTAGSRTRPPTKSHSWRLALRAYALGPVNLVVWPSEKQRLAWTILGAGSLAAAVLLSIRWSAFLEALEPREHGAVIWTVSITLVIVLLATTWARSVATSAPEPRWPRRLRTSGAVCALGLVLPGLGCLIAQRRWKAAAAIWCAGLLVAAVMIVTHWRWLAVAGGSAEGGTTSPAIEVVLAAAACVVVIGILAWLAQAFDGVRAVSPNARSGVVANRLALALLVALVVFAVTFRPQTIARDLGSVAVTLQQQGLKVIPLALYEAASKLDPTTPAYLAETATLHEALGLSEQAEVKRELLQKQATQFASAIGAELVTTPTWQQTLQPQYPVYHVPPHARWNEPTP